MKLSIIYKILIVGILEILLLYGCKNPLEDFQLKFKDPINQSKLEIRFSSTTGKLPEDMVFTIAGKDADLIVTHLNTKNFKINKEGIIFLAVKPEILPSKEQPVTFTVIAEAKGYTKIIREFTFSSTGNQSFNPRFFSSDTPPNGVTAKQFEVNTDNSGAANKAYVLEASSAKQENARVTIPSGTVMKNAHNEAVSGKIAVVVHHFDNRSGGGYLPEGGLARNPVDKDNKPLPDAFNFASLASFVSIEMSSEKQQVVRTFTQPIEVTFELNPATVNNDTKKVIKEGDLIPLISYDNEKFIWKVEGTVPIVKNATSGKLECTAKVSHLSYWVVGWTQVLCKQGPAFTIKSNFAGVDLLYYCVLVNAKTGAQVASYYVSFNNGSRFGISNMVNDGVDVKLRVFNYNHIYGGDNTKSIFESEVFKVCDSKSFTIDVSLLPIPPAVEIEFEITCPKGKTLDPAAVPAQLKTQFSEPGKNQWRDMPSIP